MDLRHRNGLPALWQSGQMTIAGQRAIRTTMRIVDLDRRMQAMEQRLQELDRTLQQRVDAAILTKFEYEVASAAADAPAPGVLWSAIASGLRNDIDLIRAAVADWIKAFFERDAAVLAWVKDQVRNAARAAIRG